MNLVTKRTIGVVCTLALLLFVAGCTNTTTTVGSPENTFGTTGASGDTTPADTTEPDVV
ncbi:MAG: hypothetical protein HY832_02390 [Candidatus Aenigmarchaeota archaeon]|nr:hypothetical protein [Candidatus Aenigmarchaeota archaeon]